MKSTATKSAKESILETASDLFYRQGYQATGINEIIAKSGVAKATFYTHFRSKEELCLAYVKNMGHRDMANIKEGLEQFKTPYQRFVGLIELLESWMQASNFKGCGYLNMIAEVTDPHNPIRQEGKQHYESVRSLIHGLAQDLIESDKKKYGHLNAKQLADHYMVILSGGVALGEIYSEITPLVQATQMVKELVA